MRGKTVVITGATSGIGEVAALQLAARGARIVIVARDAARAAVTLARLRNAGPGEHAVHIADLSQLAEMKRVGAAIAVHETRVDVLLNNAGAVFMGRHRTVDGLAPSFALNHLAYFVLTLSLLPLLQRTPGARIVCTSSRAHRYGRMRFDDLQRDGIGGYADSKLANLLFMRRLAQLLDPGGVTVNALHPGFVATRFADNTGAPWRALMRWRKRRYGLSPEQGARTLVYLAESADVAGQSGGYYVDCRLASPSVAAQSDADAQHLWTISVRLTGFNVTPAARRA